MTNALLALTGVLAVSMVSLVGIIFFLVSERTTRKILLFAVSLSTGAILGDVFIHMLPEIAEAAPEQLPTNLLIMLGGIVFSFCLEKLIHWRHCHELPDDHDHSHGGAHTDHRHHHHHTVGAMAIIGETMHNFVDGVVIAAAFLVSIPLGATTTVAILFHEIPHEIGNFAVLLHSGYSKTRALAMNLAAAGTGLLGAVCVLLLGTYVTTLNERFLPFAAGNLLYIAAADLIPELHRESQPARALVQVVCLLAGIGLMLLLTLSE